MDKKLFKTSEQLGISDNDAKFMTRFESNLQLESLPKLKPKLSGYSLLMTTALSAAAALIVWFLIPYFFQSATTVFQEVEVLSGVSVGILFGVLALIITLFFEAEVEDLSNAIEL